MKLSTISGVIGNVFEWFDFLLYAAFAPVFSKLFFPSKDPLVSIILTFGVFAISFFIRPIGGYIMGRIGDHYGRRKALILTISSVSISTMAMALLPTYAQVGALAPILLMVVRMIQCFGISGEFSISSAYVIEHAANNRRGFAGSLVACSAMTGVLLAAIFSFLVAFFFTGSALTQWGWRFAYGVAGILSFLGLFIRLRSEETPYFLKTDRSVPPDRSKPSWKGGLKKHKVSIILIFIAICLYAVGNYYLIGYFTNYLVFFVGMPLKDALLINCLSLFVLVCCIPIFGFLSDQIGRKPIFILGSVFLGIFILPISHYLSLNHRGLAMAAEIVFAILQSMVIATAPTIIAEIFTTRVRNTFSALAYNLGLALFGGTAPSIALFLLSFTKSHFAPAAYFIICAVISLIAILFLPESYHKPLR